MIAPRTSVERLLSNSRQLCLVNKSFTFYVLTNEGSYKKYKLLKRQVQHMPPASMPKWDTLLCPFF